MLEWGCALVADPAPKQLKHKRTERRAGRWYQPQHFQRFSIMLSFIFPDPFNIGKSHRRWHLFLNNSFTFQKNEIHFDAGRYCAVRDWGSSRRPWKRRRGGIDCGGSFGSSAAATHTTHTAYARTHLGLKKDAVEVFDREHSVPYVLKDRYMEVAVQEGRTPA